jgi:hypothetical protein
MRKDCAKTVPAAAPAAVAVGTPSNTNLHVAIVAPDLAGSLLDGSKRIETRFSRTRRAPYGSIRPGERIVFRLPGGRTLGWARASRVQHLEHLTPGRIERLRRIYAPSVCAAPHYWAQRRTCRRRADLAGGLVAGGAVPVDPAAVWRGVGGGIGGPGVSGSGPVTGGRWGTTIHGWFSVRHSGIRSAKVVFGAHQQSVTAHSAGCGCGFSPISRLNKRGSAQC